MVVVRGAGHQTGLGPIEHSDTGTPVALRKCYLLNTVFMTKILAGSSRCRPPGYTATTSASLSSLQQSCLPCLPAV